MEKVRDLHNESEADVGPSPLTSGPASFPPYTRHLYAEHCTSLGGTER